MYIIPPSIMDILGPNTLIAEGATQLEAANTAYIMDRLKTKVTYIYMCVQFHSCIFGYRYISKCTKGKASSEFKFVAVVNIKKILLF